MNTQTQTIPTIAGYEVLYAYQLSQEVQQLCSRYFLLHWSGNHLRNALVGEEKNILRNNGIPFIVQFVDEDDKLNCINANRVALSFRCLEGEKVGYVIPKVIYGMPAP